MMTLPLPLPGTNTSASGFADLHAEPIKFRDFAWLMDRLKGNTVSGVTNLYKNSKGKKSYDVGIESVVGYVGGAGTSGEVLSLIYLRSSVWFSLKLLES